ncbi:hypothetical protein IC229_01730 [Spirosoma sp. BT702]|uniref:Uncharacterized protein n=2 Tax=Spirosoma profusum TaxID=2771354 RepID=A0A926XSR8_9BACT|nr:hypothetical protein [Spirosoma profusum]
MIAVFAACSRPVAYFQPSAREHYTQAPAKSEVVSPVEATAPATLAPAVTPAEQVAQANAQLDKVDALVRNDSKLAADKTVQKRLNRIRALVASTTAKTNVASVESGSTKKMNLVERMMLKKMNKKISKQLAPANPEKTMLNSGTLATGAVLVLIGLLLLLLSTGTGATIGLIALIVGAVLLLVGLL